MAMLRLPLPDLASVSPPVATARGASGVTLPRPRLSPTLARVLMRLGAVLWWLTLRLLVAAVCVGVMLALAQLTVHSLLAYYVDIAPYAGTAG